MINVHHQSAAMGFGNILAIQIIFLKWWFGLASIFLPADPLGDGPPFLRPLRSLSFC
jgi:hypothetical protein